MPEMSRFEKAMVNRRGARFFVGLLNRLDREGVLQLPPNSAVLELGSGNGALSILLNERYHPARIHATDYDPEQVATAKRAVQQRYGEIPPGFIVERVDATRIPYPTASFDLVVAHYVLHHLGGLQARLKGVQEVARVLRPKRPFLYVEMFQKKAIREELARLGFRFRYQRRSLRFMGFTDIVVAETGATPH